MRKSVKSSLIVLAGSLASYACIAAFDSTPALASRTFVTWTQDINIPGFSGGPGCAKGIAVGPNNAPWVLGCGTTDGFDWQIFQLETVNGTRQWGSNGGAGIALTVDTTSVPWATTVDGHIWLNVTIFGGPSHFIDVTASAITGGFPFGSGRLTGISVLVTPQRETDIWGLGYTTAPDKPVYEAVFSSPSIGNPGPWSPEAGGAGSKIVIFTGTIFGQSYQTPWTMNSSGAVSGWVASDNQFEAISTPAPVLDITDHWILTSISGSPYLYQDVDLSGWLAQAGGTTPNGTNIVQIANSMGSPQVLWGVDTAGHIFTSNTSVGQR